MELLKRIMIISLGVLIIVFAIGATFVSTGLSIAYFQTLTTDEMLSIVVFGFVILLQTMVLLGSVSKGVIYKKTPQHYYTVIYFTRICFVISVLSTISFFNVFDKSGRELVIKDLLYSIPFLNLNYNSWLVDNLTNMTLIWASCIVLDLMSMYFPSIGSDLITGISTMKKLDIKDKGYVMKILELITFHPKKLIDKKCYNLGIIDENPLHTLRSLHNKCNEQINVTGNTLHNSLQTENSLQDFITPLQKPITSDKKPLQKHVTQNVMNTVQTPTNIDKKVCNERNDYSNEKLITENQVSLQKEAKKCNEGENPLQNLITNIDSFITENYKCNEKINVGDVKKKFGLKPNDRKWNDKIRNNLKSCKIINGRLTRIEDVKNIKLVK